MNSLNKEEILARSRKENEIRDERSEFIRMKGANFSVGVLIFVWIVLGRLAPLDTVGKLALGLLANVTCLSNFGYQLVYGKTKTAFFFVIVFTLTTVFYALRFFWESGIF